MAKRSVLLPGVPPIAETVPGFDWCGWIAVAGPADMPTPVVKMLATKSRTCRRRRISPTLLNAAAMEPTDPIPPEEMAGFVRDEYERWGPVDQGSPAPPPNDPHLE